MRAQIIRDLLREYAQKREKAQREAELRRQIIAQDIPLYRDVGTHLAAVMARCAARGEDPIAAVSALREKAYAALAQAGHAREDLAPSYACALCRDTGYVGEPIYRFCSCFEKRLQEEVIKRSGLGSAPGHTFANFDLSVFSDEGEGRSQRETMRRMHAYAHKWAEHFPGNDARDLLLSGPSGLGKTFLLDCIAARVIERGYTVLRMTAFRLLEALRMRHMGRDEGDLMGVMLSVDLLLIDDLGTEPLLENISIEYLFTVLNERQQALKSTLVATNLSLAELRARYTERITSRLLNAQCAAVFLLDGQDVRLRRG